MIFSDTQLTELKKKSEKQEPEVLFENELFLIEHKKMLKPLLIVHLKFLLCLEKTYKNWN